MNIHPVNNQTVNFSIILGLSLLLLAVVSGAYYLWKQSNSEIQIVNTSEHTLKVSQNPSRIPTPTSTSTPSIMNKISIFPDITSTWNIYSNSIYRFTIKYPKKVDKHPEAWQYEEFGTGVGFGTLSSKSGGYIWVVSIFENQGVEELIKRPGDQFLDRKELRHNINIGGVPALLVTVTTKRYPDWILKAVYIQLDNRVYVIENGAINLVEFDAFYNSFRFFQ